MEFTVSKRAQEYIESIKEKPHRGKGFGFVEMEQGTQEWRDYRNSRIGASDVPIIVGASPWSTPLQLMKQKLGLRSSKPSANMLAGIEKEDEIRDACNRELGFSFKPVVIERIDIDWAMASLDGYDHLTGAGLEIKLANKDDFAMCMEDVVTPKYVPQLTWQCYVMESPSVLFACMNRGHVAVALYDVVPDDIILYFSQCHEFHEMMIEGELPPPCDRDYVEIEDPSFQLAADAWLHANMKLKQAQDNEKLWRDELIKHTDDGNCCGYGVKLNRIKRDGVVDWQQLCTDRGISIETIEKYRKPQIGYWKVSPM